jgi:hypothetical protein
MATKAQQRNVTTETDASLSALVVKAISAATETPVDELPPLFHVIDPDALDVLFSGCDTDGSVEFQYAGRTVTIFADRTIEVSPASERPNRPTTPQVY